MKNAKKLTLVLSLAALAMSLSVAGVVAKAEESETTDYFKFIDGAAVRLVDDEMGEAIRFESQIGKDYYDNLVKNNSGKTVTLYSEVTDANDPSKSALEQSWVLVGTGAEEIEFNSSNMAKFYHAIEFEDVFGLGSANQSVINQANALELTAKMYIEVYDGTTTETITATNGVTEVTRSARAIANMAYDEANATEENSKGETDAERLEKYFGTRTEVEKGIYFEAGDTLTTVLSKDLDGFDLTTAEVYGYKNVLALEGELSTIAACGSTLGDQSTVGFTLFDQNNNILNVPAGGVMYVTKALKTEADLKVFDIEDTDDDYTTLVTKQITGYYVLANNIVNDPEVTANQHEGLAYNAKTFSGVAKKWSPKYNTSTTTGFAGTFDGQGYTMAFDVYKAGLFGYLQPASVVKNVGMDVTFTNTEASHSSVIAVMAPKSKDAANKCDLSDIYININDFRSALNSSYTGLFAYADSNSDYIEMTRVVMNLNGVVLNDSTVASGALYMQDTNNNSNTARLGSVFVISNTTMWMSMDENTSTTNRNLKTVARSDVNDPTYSQDKVGTEPNYDTTATLKYDMGESSIKAGTAVTERGVAATGAIHCQISVNRYNSLEEMNNNHNDATFSAFSSANGWDTSSGVPVWATFPTENNE